EKCRKAVGHLGCTLTRESTQGPYYWNSTVRQDITEGKPGIPFRLTIRVLDTNTCEPLQNALVDIWQCDAVGLYSHFIALSQGIIEGRVDNETFLRGLSLTNADGVAQFETIYPGWYRGRATHIHVKVHSSSKENIIMVSNSSGVYSGGHVSHTGQLYFNDRFTDRVARERPYSTHKIARTRNVEDEIYMIDNDAKTQLDVKFFRANDFRRGLTATVTLGVDPTAETKEYGQQYDDSDGGEE
ncbi:unnamed protein product, partial [Didymodactylos carnosus]